VKNSAIAWIAGAIAFASLAGIGATSAATTDVTLVVNGQPTALRTNSGTVTSLLSSHDITVGAHDAVSPAPSTHLSDGMTVTVLYGRQLDVTIDGNSQELWTVGTTVGGVLDDLGLTDPGLTVTPDPSTPITGDGVAIVVNTPKLVSITADGQTTSLQTTSGTVGSLLAARGVTLDSNDRVSPDLATPLVDGLNIVVQRVTTTQETVTVPVPFTTQQVVNASLAKGKTQIQTQGVNGSKNQTWSVTMVDGDEESRTLVSETVTKQPVTQVEQVGTKVAAPRPAPTVNTGNSAATNNTNSSSVVAYIRSINPGNAIINLFASQVGKAYVYGATGPNAFDCSGLIYYVYHNNFGYNIPRTAYAQGQSGTQIAWANIQPGDVIYSTGHIGVYVGGGLMIHAATPGQGVIVSSAAAYQARGYHVARLG